ncbi:hypothetical protein EOT10_25860 [Streptomyces antnestii]|uniref:Uncharacterized protein n=1 Tax=Streptomyces antnestii TaxID=2494256 RepID=A0A437PGP8_9ACTN|nr:hypothetical protein [Streptomyces sp. San01]RVU21443.1 hypothetical protein EOT10_25860 [Streptomyces sp. San01]
MSDDRVFVRSKWGTNRYVYNAANPIGMALIIGSLLFAAAGMFFLYHPDLFKGGWDGGDLRKAVSGATAELSAEKALGPGGDSGLYGDVLKQKINEHGHGPEDAVKVVLASKPAESDLWSGGLEEASYTVSARGTGTALCLHVSAMKKAKAMGYDSVDFTVDDGAC